MKVKHIPKLLGVMSIAAITGFFAPAVVAHPGHSSHHHIITRNSPDSDRHYEKSHKRKKHGLKHRHHDRGHRYKHKHKYHGDHHAKKHYRHGYGHRHVPRYADHYRDGIVIKLYKHF